MLFRSGKTLARLFCAFCLLISFSSQASAVLTPLNDDTMFVEQVYQDFLNRAPDAEGLAYWAGEISGGNLTRTQMVEQYLVSAEFGETISPVVRLYFTYYSRIPDYDGLMFWVNSYAAGMSLNDISDAFATAQEFIDIYGSLSNEEFISKMYINVYGRQPDAGGLAYWTNILDTSTLTRGQVMVEFSTADEYLALSANQVYVTMTYMGLLRRAPEQGGFDFWVGAMENGTPGTGLIEEFLFSDEYAARFSDSNQDLWPNIPQVYVGANNYLYISELATDLYQFIVPQTNSYRISLTNTQSDLSWELTDSPEPFSTILAECDNYLTAQNEVCTTPTLNQGSDYILIIDEWDSISGTYTLRIDPQ